MSNIKLAVIVDNRSIARYQMEALLETEFTTPLLILNCTNTTNRRRLGKHFLYYLLNLVTIRNRLTQRVPLDGFGVSMGEIVDFESEYEGAWQRLPPAVQKRISLERPDAILRFGMSLLRVPEGLPPILSYHHGDPERYRGRPAGFYETLHGEKSMGQIVQILSDKLDAGKVVAFGETKLIAHSYRATLLESYRHSKLLLPEALRNLAAGRTVHKAPVGRTYRLPSNLTVARMCFGMAVSLVKRIGYGLFKEKGWEVSLGPVPDAGALFSTASFPPQSTWRQVPKLPQYRFYADPFFCSEGLLIEALRRRSGKGEILLVGKGQRRLSDPARHFSYPGEIMVSGQDYVIPEVAGWSEPRIFKLGENGFEAVGLLKVGSRVLDPTLLDYAGRIYLFGNDAEMGGNALNLWSAESLFDEFTPHPLSPILISPRGGRMAGQILRRGDRLIRLGQNNLNAYGNGVFAFEIARLGTEAYEERPLGQLRFDGVSGPHTVNFREGEAVFDWYRDSVSPLAGVRRILGKYL